MKLIVSTALCILMHVLVGWQWSIVGGLVAGFWSLKRGWLAGALAVGLGWAILVAYNLFVASDPTQRMFDVAGQLIGGLPPVMIPLATILVGIALGAVAGFTGRALGGLRKEPVVVEIE